MLFKLHSAETLSIEIIVDLWYYVIAERETNQSMINKEIANMKKFTRIITAVMAAATIAVTTTSVCASARTLVTGEVLTDEVVDRYATVLKALNTTSDQLIIFSHEYGFFNTDKSGIMGCNKDYNGAWIDYWAGLQKSKLCQEREGYTSILDPFSRG